MNTALDHRHKYLRDCADSQLDPALPLLRRIKATLKEWDRRHGVRSQLRAEMRVMDVARIEKDAGLTTGTLRQEATKPFWKA